MNIKTALLGATMLIGVTSAPASATILLDLVNAPGQNDTPYAIAFTAGSGTTTISFAGYQKISFESASNIGLFLNNSGANLTGGTTNGWTYTPAALGAFADNDGSVLLFGGVNVGFYDTFAQNFVTAAGSSYTLRFNYSNSFEIGPSGFRVEASNATIGTVPEPATWAMMIVGFGAIGLAMRSTARRSEQKFDAKVKRISEGAVA
jgi:hypothetical protein